MQDRVTGQAYDNLVDELLTALRARYGPRVLIHWEDFGVGNAFRLLAKYQQQVSEEISASPLCLNTDTSSIAILCNLHLPAAQLSIIPLRHVAVQGYATFNDDIQATAAVTLGSLYGAQRQAGVPKMGRQSYLFFGAGQANIGAAKLLTLALAQEGLSEQEAKSRIWLIDSQVLRCPDRNTHWCTSAVFLIPANIYHPSRQARHDLQKPLIMPEGGHALQSAQCSS